MLSVTSIETDPLSGNNVYGETANLGRDTTKVSIGTDYTAPFSNVLTNLRQNTTYFCRAVMQNEHGIVKGEIVRFTTKDKDVPYVAPKTVTKTTVKKKTVKDEVVCSDGTILKTSTSQADIINNGDKLIGTVLEKVSGDITPNGEVNYRLNYENISGSRLDNVIIKVTVPQEFTFVNSNVGSYDDITHTLTFNQNTLDGFAKGTVLFKVKVADSASLGKSIVTTGYVSYTFRSDKGDLIADEAISYSVGSIIPNDKLGGDKSAFYTGQITGSHINTYDYFDEFANPYLFPTESVDINKFNHTDFNVTLNNVSSSVVSSIRQKLEKLLKNCRNQCWDCHECERTFGFQDVDSALQLRKVFNQ